MLVVARGAGEREVELARGVVRREAGTSVLLARDRPRQGHQVGFTAARGGHARDPRLEDQPDLQPSQHGVEPEVGRPEPAVRVRLDEPLGGQPAQGLAHGRPGDPQALGEFDLPEPRARGDVAFQDELPDALVGEVHDAVDLKHEAAR